MKKLILRKLRKLSDEIIGEKETDKIIKEAVKEVIKEIKPKPKKKNGDRK